MVAESQANFAREMFFNKQGLYTLVKSQVVLAPIRLSPIIHLGSFLGNVCGAKSLFYSRSFNVNVSINVNVLTDKIQYSSHSI